MMACLNVWFYLVVFGAGALPVLPMAKCINVRVSVTRKEVEIGSHVTKSRTVPDLDAASVTVIVTGMHCFCAGVPDCHSRNPAPSAFNGLTRL